MTSNIHFGSSTRRLQLYLSFQKSHLGSPIDFLSLDSSTDQMAQWRLRYPPKSEENRKTANVCEHCRRQGIIFAAVYHSDINQSAPGLWSSQLAASKLKDGIIHLTIDQLDEAHRNGHQVTPEDVERLWEALVAGACENDCGCAQVLLQHVRLPIRSRLNKLSASP